MAGAWRNTAWSAGLRGLVFVIAFILLSFSFLGFDKKFAEYTHEESDPHKRKMIDATAEADRDPEGVRDYYLSQIYC